MNRPRTLTECLAAGLRALGCRHALGVSGAAIGRFTAAARRAGLEVIHTRHEAGAGFMAAEASLAAGRPEAVFTTTGPGLSNAITGLVAGAWAGAHTIAVVGGTARERVGRFAFQETAAAQLSLGVWLPPGFPHRVIDLGVVPLSEALALAAADVARPEGCLSMLLLPTDVQQDPSDARVQPHAPAPVVPPPYMLRDCVRRLSGRRVVCWVGHEARGAATEVRALVEALGAVVMSTPRGKGVFPESHPALIGVTGLGGADGVAERLAAAAPDVALVLGCRLGEFGSWWDDTLLPPEGLIHVGLTPSAAAFPGVPGPLIAADVAAFCSALLLAGPRAAPCRRLAPRSPLPVPTAPEGLHPAELMAGVQAVIVEASEALVISEAGNAFAWASHALRFPSPRYRVSTDFGAMGHASTGVVGMALATGEKAVALLGDGAMLMSCELNTAVACGARAVWVLLNDSGYGMIRHGMAAIGEAPVAGRIPRVDFVAFARAQGADGVSVDTPAQLRGALRQAMAAAGPFVVDVRIDPSVPPPFGARNNELSEPEEPTWRG